jgi:hypothetical protein
MIRKILTFFIVLLTLNEASYCQIITHTSGEIEIHNVTSTDGPMGSGSLLWFSSGDNSTAIQ